MRADRSPNPALHEVKKVYQQVQFALADDKIAVTNEYLFSDLGRFALAVELLENGVKTKQAMVAMPAVAPGETGYVDIPFDLPELPDECALNVTAVQKAEERGIPAGYAVATEQLPLGGFKPVTATPVGGKAVSREGNDIIIECGTLTVKVDGDSGYISSLQINGSEKLIEPIKPNFWRAPIDNDKSPQLPPIAQGVFGKYAFKKANESIVKSKCTVTDKCVEIDWYMPKMLSLKTKYEATDKGLKVTMSCMNALFGLPRYGFEMKLDASADVAFYARGPHENYCDRKTSAPLGVYEGRVEDFQHDYLVPQENGNHCDARWLKVGGEEGVRFSAVDTPFEFSCHNYSKEALERATHLHELAKNNDGVYVFIDGKQRGVGGDVPALACVKKPYKIAPYKVHTLSFLIS